MEAWSHCIKKVDGLTLFLPPPPSPPLPPQGLLSLQHAVLPGCQHSAPITTTRTSPLIGLLTPVRLESRHAIPTGAPGFKESKRAHATEPQLADFERIRLLLPVLGEALPLDLSAFNVDKLICSLFQSIMNSFLCAPPASSHSALGDRRKIKTMQRNVTRRKRTDTLIRVSGAANMSCREIMLDTNEVISNEP